MRTLACSQVLRNVDVKYGTPQQQQAQVSRHQNNIARAEGSFAVTASISTASVRSFSVRSSSACSAGGQLARPPKDFRDVDLPAATCVEPTLVLSHVVVGRGSGTWGTQAVPLLEASNNLRTTPPASGLDDIERPNFPRRPVRRFMKSNVASPSVYAEARVDHSPCGRRC